MRTSLYNSSLFLLLLAPAIRIEAAPATNAAPVSATIKTAPVPIAANDWESVLASRPIINETLTAERAVEIALRESPVIRGAVAEIEAEEGRLNSARAERKPMVSANTFLSGGSISNIVESPQAVQPSMIMNLPRGGYFDQNLMVMFPLFTGGRLKSAVKQAASLRDASQSDLEAQRQEVALLTRLAFHETQARRALVDVQQARLRENEEQLRINRALSDEGKIPPFFVLRSEAEVAATNQELTNARRDVELSNLQLQTVMGIHPASQIQIKGDLSYEPSTAWLPQLANSSISSTPATAADLPALLRLAERQRPELRAAQSRVLAAQSESATIGNSYRPQINAFGMADALKAQGERATVGATFGLVASISIWSGGQKSARLQTANAARRVQQAELEKVALQIGQEVGAAVLNLRAAEQNIQSAQIALKSSEEDYRVARIRYEAGKSVLVEVLDALASRVRAHSNVVQALYSYNNARDQLQRAVGDKLQ